MVGDWNGSGATKVGIYRASTGQWFVDYYGNHTTVVTYSFVGYNQSNIPVVGDWSGSGTSKIGVFGGASNPLWMLDANGDGSFDGSAGSPLYGK